MGCVFTPDGGELRIAAQVEVAITLLFLKFGYAK
jgi:hypothetical protein